MPKKKLRGIDCGYTNALNTAHYGRFSGSLFIEQDCTMVDHMYDDPFLFQI